MLTALPDLADDLSEAERRLAERILCPTRRFAHGERLPSTAPGDGVIALVVADGFLLRQVDLTTCRSLEVLGPGDVVTPWAGADLFATVQHDYGFHALTDVTLAALTPSFAAALPRVPGLLSGLVARVARRANCLAAIHAIRSVRRVDERLTALFEHLGDLFGKVTPDGVVIPIPLTHQQLGRIVGAERPSVTTSLVRLRNEGLVSRRPDGGWLYQGAVPRARADAAHHGRPVADA